MEKLLTIIVLGLLINGCDDPNQSSIEKKTAKSIIVETIILKCERNYYKYVSDGNSVKIYQSMLTKKKDWWIFPKTKVQDDNKHIFRSIIDGEAIINGYVVTEKWSKIRYSGTTAKKGVIIVDFKNKTFKGKAIKNGKAWSSKEKCKVQKS